MSFWRLGAASVVPSIILTSLLLLYLWSWLAPADFWQRLVALIVVLLVGAVSFVALLVLFSLLMLPLFAILLRRRMRKAFKKRRDELLEGYE
jgi:hypothetical protein